MSELPDPTETGERCPSCNHPWTAHGTDGCAYAEPGGCWCANTGAATAPAVVEWAAVWPMDEGGIAVKTPSGIAAARAVYAEWLAGEDTCGDEIPAQVQRATYREGWYRWTPCSERSCYDHGNHRPGHLKYETGPGRGVWRGVLVNCS